jgi:TetR/AcrR family transcriptional regulator, transcriptional repressor for nem operon
LDNQDNKKPSALGRTVIATSFKSSILPSKKPFSKIAYLLVSNSYLSIMVARPIVDTKSEILRIGKELIQQLGYNAFSYADIARKLGVRNAAIHYHFPAKEDLLSALVDSHIEQYRVLDAHLHAAGLSAKERLDKFIERYSMLVEGNNICIIGSVASDFNTLPEAVKEKMGRLVELVLGLVEKTLEDGRNSGEFKFTEHARTQTLLVMTNLAAGVQLARITGKKDYETIREGIMKQLL